MDGRMDGNTGKHLSDVPNCLHRIKYFHILPLVKRKTHAGVEPGGGGYSSFSWQDALRSGEDRKYSLGSAWWSGIHITQR